MEWIYFVVIFFYILSALSKAAKKKQEAEKAAAAKKPNRRVQTRPSPRREAFEKAAEAVTELPLSEISRYINKRMNVPEVEEPDYDLTAKFEPGNYKEEASIEREHSVVSHFREAHGMQRAISDLSQLATAPTISAPVFVFAPRKALPRVPVFNRGDLKKYLIMTEVLGKPRSLRRR